MHRYTLKPHKSQRYLIDVEFRFEAPHDQPEIQVPYWRPGRYEAGNFPKNIIGFEVCARGRRVHAPKIDTHRWRVDVSRGEALTAKYTLYARELSAGNTYYDKHVLLVNPVNALVYVLGTELQEAEVALELPEEWQTATSLSTVEETSTRITFQAPHLQSLLDSPILAAARIHRLHYREADTDFHIDIYGETNLDTDRMMADFQSFTRTQLHAFGSFPVSDYRFLFMLMPFRTYHGVEHERSTVIVLGPADDLDKPDVYKEFLGISSHELYHTWNVKRFRPREWTPYDYARPAPSRLGYVAEGVTTYMGDKMLWLADVFNDEEFFAELATHFRRHMHALGRFNISLADASIDTWVDGYGRGTPDRRISIYAEGAMLATVIDIRIALATEGRAGLDTVMQGLYQTVDPDSGYTEDEFWHAVKQAADVDWDRLRREVLDDRGYLEGYFRKALNDVGLAFEEVPPSHHLKADYGLHVEVVDGRAIVWNIAPDSPAHHSDLCHDDVLLEINEAPASEFLETDKNFSPASLRITYRAGRRTMREMLEPAPKGRTFFPEYRIHHADGKASDEFRRWIRSGRTAVDSQ